MKKLSHFVLGDMELGEASRHLDFRSFERHLLYCTETNPSFCFDSDITGSANRLLSAERITRSDQRELVGKDYLYKELQRP